ncbi:MAG: metal ABC transporter solute-binding protein, Zn/Mn family, partial [Phycisphaerae bacterium]
DLVLYNGLMLEGKMASALNKISKRKRVRAVADAVPKESLMVPEGEEGHADPHLWMDVSLWKQVSILIRNELTELDPSGSDYFADRCKTYVEKLEKLHAYATSAITGVPNQQRLLVTAHDAFQYMGRAYGFEVRGIQGISTESEAGIADVNALVDLLVSRNVQAIFVETSVSDKNVRALIEGAAARGHTVTIGGTLYSDAMGPAQTYEGTYIGMIDHNVTVIASALGGSVPEKGLNQKLNR